MADPNFQFNPPDGHNNTVEFPTAPNKEAVRGLMQKLHDQARDFINDTLIPWINATFALKSDVQNMVLGQIPNDSITDLKLSSAVDQIKPRVNTHLAATTGVHGLDANSAKFKSDNATFTDRDTAQTFTDAFCTPASLVTISITSGTKPQGVWTVTSEAGAFTITSSAPETSDITFDYFIQKAVG